MHHGQGLCYGLDCVPWDSQVEVLTPHTQNVTLFGNRVFMKVIKLKWRLQGRPWSNTSLIKKGKQARSGSRFL
jgi:hypothetical protein